MKCRDASRMIATYEMFLTEQVKPLVVSFNWTTHKPFLMEQS